MTSAQVNQEAVARLAGVSQRTVSRCFADAAKVNPRTYQSVLRAAEQIGYRPHAPARATRTGRFGQVALVLGRGGERGLVLSEMLDGFQHALEAYDLSMILSRLPDEDFRSLDTMPRVFRDSMVEGLLISPVDQARPEQAQFLDRLRIPAVWIKDEQQTNCVCFDDYDAGRCATEHLLSLGHRRIAFSWSDHEHVRDTLRRPRGTVLRAAAYVDVLREAGLEPRFAAAPPRPGDWGQWAAEVLDAADGATAILGYTRWHAVPLVHQAVLRGLRVPQDLSVMTFSAGPCDELGTAITSMTVSRRQFAQEAVAMLMKRIADPTCHLPQVRVALHLREGATTSNPPDGA